MAGVYGPARLRSGRGARWAVATAARCGVTGLGDVTQPAARDDPGSEAVGEPRFSVVIPLHNKVRHVEDAIRSVLAQTLTGFEIVVVDDASTDGSREVVDRLVGPRVRLLRRDRPGPGGYAARNLGTSVAAGEWITYLDADDMWSEDRLERLQDAIQRYPDANLHACAWFVATRDGTPHSNKYARTHGARGGHRVGLADYLVSLRQNRPVIHTDTVAIRRSILGDGAVFPADLGLRRGGDGYAWLRLMCRERSLVWSPNVGARYYVDSDNMVTRNVKVNVASLARPLIQALDEGLSAGERRLLRRAANGLLWSNWLAEVLQGRPAFAIRGRLFWRGAWGQALAIAAASLVPARAIRGLRRVAKFSSSGG